MIVNHFDLLIAGTYLYVSPQKTTSQACSLTRLNPTNWSNTDNIQG